LSYTSFDYADLTLSAHHVEADDTVNISLTVTNTGDQPGTEVVQLYLSDRFASISRPVLELAGFRRVHLEPGQMAQVDFALDVSQAAFLDAGMRWRVEAGEVDVLVGASSQDLRLADMVSIGSDTLVDGATRGFYA
jgi:beta-glucosidase